MTVLSQDPTASQGRSEFFWRRFTPLAEEEIEEVWNHDPLTSNLQFLLIGKKDKKKKFGRFSLEVFFVDKHPRTCVNWPTLISFFNVVFVFLAEEGKKTTRWILQYCVYSIEGFLCKLATNYVETQFSSERRRDNNPEGSVSFDKSALSNETLKSASFACKCRTTFADWVISSL